MNEQIAIYACREGKGKSFEVILDPNDDPPAEAMKCKLHPGIAEDWAILLNIIVREVACTKINKISTS